MFTVGCTLWEPQEYFLVQHFNCGRQRVETNRLAIQDACRPDPDFEATDSECNASSAESVFLESGSDEFVASDEDGPGEAEASRKRPYAERRREQIKFLGKPVCLRALSRLLGVGQTTLQKLREGEKVYTQKSKAKVPVHPGFGFAIRGDTAEKWPAIVMFLWYIYHSVAECMPTNSSHALKPKLLEETPFVGSEPMDPDDVTRHVNTYMHSLEKYHSDIDIHLIGPGTFRGERRHLQRSSRSELYFEYLAYSDSVGDTKPASFTTFLRVANKVLGPHQRSGHLHFRKPGEHAKCDVCTRLKKLLKFKSGQMITDKDKDATTRAYSNHILSQWLDRQCYWSMRTLSQTWFRQQHEVGERTSGVRFHFRLLFPCFFPKFLHLKPDCWDYECGICNLHGRMLQASIATNLCTVMADSMDQAKFKVPRIRDFKSKLLAKLFRPRLHCGGVWCHGRTLAMAISDECMPKDSVIQIEQVSRVLNSLFEEYGTLPMGFSYHADNTYRESKNRHFLAWLILLCALRVFRWTMASFLRPGHSSFCFA